MRTRDAATAGRNTSIDSCLCRDYRACNGGGPVSGTVVAAAGGHGMMWGPGVSKAAADLAVSGTTDLVDVTDLGLDRFDEHGRSRLATDPIALPFPVDADDVGVPAR